MTKARLLVFPLTLALALAGASAVLADEHETTAFDVSSIPEVNQDEALILLHQLRENLLAAGVAAEDLEGAIGALSAEAANLSEADYDELLAAKALRDPEDEEFGQAEEDEPELGDDEAGGEDEEESE